MSWGPIARPMHAAPFHARAYGGFSNSQAEFISSVVGNFNHSVIIDPMCGQAFLAASWARRGADVSLADINPGALALATLRAPDLMRDRNDNIRSLRRLIRGLEATSPRLSIEDRIENTHWLLARVQRDLRVLGSKLKLESLDDLKGVFRERATLRRFALGICVLAARRLTAFRPSDNPTWLVPGGLGTGASVRGAISDSIQEWTDWIDKEGPKWPTGTMQFRLEPVESVQFRVKADYVITSPPYANRLDYARLWAPENAVTEAMLGKRIVEPATFLGTNVIKGIKEEDLKTLPKAARVALRDIRNHTAWASATYYFPFFATYGIELSRAFQNVARMLKKGGRAIVIGRDTVRKDTLFPTAQIVISSLRQGGCRLVESQNSVIRAHVGNLRTLKDVGLYGKAQREWWLVFEK